MSDQTPTKQLNSVYLVTPDNYIVPDLHTAIQLIDDVIDVVAINTYDHDGNFMETVIVPHDQPLNKVAVPKHYLFSDDLQRDGDVGAWEFRSIDHSITATSYDMYVIDLDQKEGNG